MAHNSIRFTWHGHSCFTIDNGKWSLVIDPYNPEMLGYPPLKVKAHAMLASHQHEDHNYMAAVDFLTSGAEDVIQYLAVDTSWPEQKQKYCYRTVDSKHDDTGGKKRGDNTIHIIRTSGINIAHLGDLGHDLTEEMITSIGNIDLLLIPVGGHFTIDAKQAIQAIRLINPRNVIPMHYQIGYGTLPIAMVDQFLERISTLYTVKDLGGPVLNYDGSEKNMCFLFQYDRSVSAGLV